MWRLAYRAEVETDVVNAVFWYDSKRPGLGSEFLLEYVAAIQRIRNNPLLVAVSANGLRAHRLKRFPYIVHFEVSDGIILVVALMGGGRDESAFTYRKN